MSNVTNDPVVLAAVAAAGFASDTETNTTEPTQPDEPAIEAVVEQKSSSLDKPWFAFAIIGFIAILAFVLLH